MTPNKALRRMARFAGAGGLLAIAGVHAAWALGYSWPAPDKRSLARAVIGRDEMPSSGACWSVAAPLLAASALVAGYPRGSGRIGWFRDAGLACVVGAFLIRGLAGAFGLLPPQRASEVFARWDRRLYSPLCFVLALLCAFGGRSSESSPRRTA